MRNLYDDLNSKTENELRSKAERLRELVRNGEATIGQANRLAEIDAMLRRFSAVATGKVWG